MSSHHKRIFSGILMGAMIVLMLIFGWTLVRLNMVPMRYLLPAGMVFLLLGGGIFLLLKKPEKKIRFSVGIVIGILLIALLSYGSVMAGKLSSAVNRMSKTMIIDSTEMKVYVLKDSENSALEDIAGASMGIMENLGREAVDQALSDLESQIGEPFAIVEYTSPVALIRGLLDNECEAILFPEEYGTMVSEMEGMEESLAMIRELSSMTVSMEREEAASEDKKEPEEGESDVLALYVSGIDTFGSISKTSRSDVNILVFANLTTRQVLMISTPRDTYLPLANSDGNYDKLTHAGIFGVENSMATLENFYEAEVSDYFRVNFSGFEDIVNALHGITLVNDVGFSAYNNEKTFWYDEGEITLEGDAALAYVRERHNVSGGDFARGRHQMMVIQAILKKCMSPEILLSFSSLLDAIDGTFDTSLSYEEMSDLVREQLDDPGEWNMISYSVTGYGTYGYCWALGSEASVVIPDEEKIETAKELIRALYAGETLVSPE